jgi:hypothetical protein
MAMGTRRKKSKSSRGVLARLFEGLESRTLFSVYTWTGAGANNNWSTPANWVGGNVPDKNDTDLDIVFPSGTPRKNTVMDVSGLEISDLTFSGNGFSINPVSGIGANIKGTISSTTAGTVNRINVFLVMSNSITINAGTGVVASDIQINGVISGGQLHTDITKTGIGVLTLSPSQGGFGNNYKGKTFITEGTVAAASNTSFGVTQPGDADTNAVIVSDGATLQILRTTSIPTLALQSLTIEGDGVGGAGALTIASNDSANAPTGAISGTVTLADETLIAVQTGATITLSGSLEGSGDLTKTGGGTLALTGGGTATGDLTAAGILQFAGGYSSMDVTSTGSVIGNGTVNSLTIVGATVNPSTGSAAPFTPGTINSTAGVTFDSDSLFSVNLASGASYDKLIVSGVVDLGGADFSGTLDGTFVPGDGTQFTIINGNNPIVGTFNGLAEGDEVTIGGRAFIISYVGGDGNDVVLTRSVHTSTTTLQVSNTNPVFGQPITLTATVTSAGTPTGTVNFKRDGNIIGSGTLTNGTTSLTISTLPVGVGMDITAEYVGDPDNATDASAVTDVTVDKAELTIAMSAQDLVGVSKPMTVSVVVTIDSPSQLTVSNLAGLQISVKDNGADIATITLDATGRGSTTITLDNLTNPHPITAEFAGDGNFETAASANQDVLAEDDVIFAVGTGPGGKTFVKVYDDQGNIRFNFQPFTANYTGGVQVATADVNGDGIKDIIVGSSAGLVPIVKVYSGATGNLPAANTPNLLMSFNPGYPASYKGGVFVAAGDTTGDGKAEISVAPKTGNGAQIRHFNITGSVATLLQAFKPYTNTYGGGAHLAIGDVNDDGAGDIIVAPGNAAMKNIKIYSGVDYSVIGNITPFLNAANKPIGFGNGFFVAAGDFNGDDKFDIVVGQGAGAKAVVKIIDGDDALANTVTLVHPAFQPYANNFGGGVRVATADINNDGTPDIITVPGAGGKSSLKIYDGTDVTTPTLLNGTPITAFTVSQTNLNPFNGMLFVG